MRFSFLLILLLFTGQITFSMCGFSGISVWPEQKYISRNPIFVVEGFSQSEHIIENLNFQYPVYLLCGNERIGLKVLKVYKGQYNLTLAILKPERELIPDKIYEIHIDSLKGTFNEDDFEVRKWTVKNFIDNKPPEWKCEPYFRNKSYMAYGCGPDKNVHFCGHFSDQSPTLVYAKVTDQSTGEVAEYYIQSRGKIITVGHGMCSGEFLVKENVPYMIQFSLMDASGNINKKLTDPLSYTGVVNKEITEAQKDVDVNCDCIKKAYYSKYITIGILALGFSTIVFLIYYKIKK